MGFEQQKVTELLSKIERHELAIPEMQREYVWENKKVKDLVHALYREHPIGLILLWELPEVEDLPVRGFLGTSFQKGKIRSVVIDGQQRLTSLLLVHKGQLKDETGEVVREIDLYFNPQTEEFQQENPLIRGKPEWFNVTSVATVPALMSLPELKKLGLSKEELFNKVLPRLEQLRNALTNTLLPVHTLNRDIDYKEITKIFIDVNSKGTRIQITELLLALLAMKLPDDFRKDLVKYEKKLQLEGWRLNRATLIRSLVAVAAHKGRLKTFESIAEDIKPDELEEKWEETKDAMSHLIKILDENLGISNTKLLPSEQVLIPLVLFLNHKKALTREDVDLLLLWFLLASYWGWYSGPTETRLDADIQAIIRDNSLKPLFRKLKTYKGRLKIGVGDFKGMKVDKLLLLYVTGREKGAVDFVRGHRITTKDFEVDHLFARSVLKKEGYKLEDIDDIANKAILTKKANRSKSAKELEEYLKGLHKDKLIGHFIPDDLGLRKVSKFQLFLKSRRKLIVKAVNKYLKKLSHGVINL